MSKRPIRLNFVRNDKELETLSAIAVLELYAQTDSTYATEFLKQACEKEKGDFITVMMTDEEKLCLTTDVESFGFTVSELPLIINP